MRRARYPGWGNDPPPLPADGTLGHLERKANKVEDDLGLLARKVDGIERRLDQTKWDSDRVRSAIQLGRKALKVQDGKLEEMKVLLDVLYQVLGHYLDGDELPKVRSIGGSIVEYIEEQSRIDGEGLRETD